MPTAAIQTTLRLPADVHQKVLEAAKREGKSVNEWFVELAKANTNRKEVDAP